MLKRLTQILIYSQVIILSLSTFELYGQFFANPSFEGPIKLGNPPPSWKSCGDFSTPDTHPINDSWNFTKQAFDGKTYLGLVTRGSLGIPSDNLTETCGVKLTKILKKNTCYKFSVYLSTFLRATYPFGFDVVPFDTPGRLNVWLSSDCNKQVLIWQSPIISNEEWKKFEFKFSTDSIRSFDALVLEADYADQNTKKFGNVLVDLVNIEEMNLKLAPASICAGGEKRFERPSIIDSIYWKGWGSNQTLLIRNEGRYPARLVSGQCIVFDTLVVKSVFPLTVTSPKDTSLCVFEEWIIDEKTPFTNYVWDNGADSSSFKVTKPGVYRLEITNDCNSIKKEFNVNFRNQCCDIEAPNIFTPNGDRINDTFELVSSSTLVTFMLRIFNRWGDEVFVTNNLQQYWNGMVNGKEASTGVYFWTVEVNCLRGTNVRSTMHRGTITVAR